MTAEDKLENLLESCSRCVEHSRDRWEKSCESIRMSKSAVSASKALLVESDRTIERLRMIVDSRAIEGARSAPRTQKFEPVVVSGYEFSDEFVALDGKHFTECTFHNCTLQYGGQAVIIESTHFHGCRLQFHSEAALTIQLLECFGLMMPETEVGYLKAVQTTSRKPLPN